MGLLFNGSSYLYFIGFWLPIVSLDAKLGKLNLKYETLETPNLSFMETVIYIYIRVFICRY